MLLKKFKFKADQCKGNSMGALYLTFTICTRLNLKDSRTKIRLYKTY